MIAVVSCRAGLVPAGADEAVSEAGGEVLLVGSGTHDAARTLFSVARTIWTVETVATSPDAPQHTAPWRGFAHLADLVVGALRSIDRITDTVIMPASPDGRDLGPHVARLLERPFFAGAIEVCSTSVSVSRRGGLEIAEFATVGPIVSTLQVGCRGVDELSGSSAVITIEPPQSSPDPTSVVTRDVLPPDAATMDLSESPRIVGGGAGLRSAEVFTTLELVARAIDASMGVTRVITDRGWVSHERQIGTTGVVVDPRLYMSFGVSGAVQHTSGLGQPEHIISVNTDPHCPMMQMSDLAIVADANEVLEELAALLGIATRQSATGRAS